MHVKLYKRAQEFGDFVNTVLKEEGIVKTITLQVTDDCNLACSYCYQICKGHRVMDIETAKEFIDLLFTGEKGFDDYLDIKHLPGVILEFIGGEPMLAVDLMDEIIDYFQEKTLTGDMKYKDRWMVSITSNGTIYTPKVKAFLKKHEHHLSYTVTIDGNKELHDSCRKFPDGRGSYDLAIKPALDMLKTDRNFGSKITISHENLPFLYEAVLNMIELGYRDIYANCVFEDVWQEGDEKIFYRELKKIADLMIREKLYEKIYVSLFEEYFFQPMGEDDNENWCGGTGKMLAVDPDGKLFPCLRYMESSVGDKYPPFTIGDLESGIGVRPAEQSRIKCMNCITRRSQSTDECYNCPVAKGCAWCSAGNYTCYGTPDKRTTFICKMHKARALANAYYFNHLYRAEGMKERIKCNLDADFVKNILSLD
ncbi:MAG: radical SAM peptide maturase, CXXX-repeat target family [Lachnospiraceae bacterium]|nr:radical SAM peptide maturase, CXXX-repeat target family [Lachnospiraceae bacterium]